MAAGSDGASLKKAPALVPGPSLVKGVYETPECSVGNLCEDLVSQYGREVGFLRPIQVSRGGKRQGTDLVSQRRY